MRKSNFDHGPVETDLEIDSALSGPSDSEIDQIVTGEIDLVARPQDPASETCANCGRKIGRLETPHVWKENIVCAQCHRVLETT